MLVFPAIRVSLVVEEADNSVESSSKNLNNAPFLFDFSLFSLSSFINFLSSSLFPLSIFLLNFLFNSVCTLTAVCNVCLCASYPCLFVPVSVCDLQ